MALDARHRFIIAKISEGFGIEESKVEKKIIAEKAAVNAFFEPHGPAALRWYYHVPEEKDKDGAYVAKGTRPQLFLSAAPQHSDRLAAAGRCVYFVRVNPRGVGERMLDADMAAGEVTGPSALDAVRALVCDVYLPVLQDQGVWGKMAPEHAKEFLDGAGKFSTVLANAIACLNCGVELRQPDKALEVYEPKPASYAAAAADEEAVRAAEECLADWCRQVDELLDDGGCPGSSSTTTTATSSNSAGATGAALSTSAAAAAGTSSSSSSAAAAAGPPPADAEPGPDVELAYWRARMARLNALSEQLKAKSARVVLGVCNLARGDASKRWKALELRVADAMGEAKDNVQYLAALEPSLAPMYGGGGPPAIRASLRALCGALAALARVSRYYGAPGRLTGLCVKVTNQIMRACKQAILAPGPLWDQPRPQLIASMRAAAELADAYRAAFRAACDEAAAAACDGGKRPEVNEREVFLRYDLLAKRLGKLAAMFTTVDQIADLAAHSGHIAGLGAVLAGFSAVVDDVRRKPYDLLDWRRTEFDRDFLDFNVNAHDLDTQMQAFVDASFDAAASTDHALGLLAQFSAVLRRDALRRQLEEKWAVAFQHYARDLEAVQAAYEAHKHKPPLPRNAPPIAGNIMWARQLLRRIELPMARFAANAQLMAARESRRTVRLYNRVARALVEFEALWHAAWLKGIDAQKAGLAAPLLVRHPETGQLLVNLDRDVMTLIREAKYMLQLGAEVPEAARLLLLQEDKFKHYLAQLSQAVREYEAMLARVPPVLKPLLRPHLDDLERKVAPGLFVLTWSSVNIDGYMHRFKQDLARVEELVRKLIDLAEHRLEANLAAIRDTLLVDLPADRSFAYDEFVAAQQRHQKRAAEALAVRNEEVARSVEDAIELVRGYPRENVTVALDEKEVDGFRAYYSGLTYRAILTATQRSFGAIKRRVGSSAATGIFYLERPFFDVNVELRVPHVAMSPSLDAIQDAINGAAKSILQASKRLRCWGQPAGAPATYHGLVAADKEVAKAVLLLAGSVERVKASVAEYTGGFGKYAFLWTQDLQAAYAAFMKGKPKLEEFEAELKRYAALEAEIAAVPTLHNIGSLSLDTAPLKASLRSAAASWKTQFAQNLHKQCSDELKTFDTYIRDVTLRLSGKADDLEDVMALMGALSEVRAREGAVDEVIAPIEEMYALLARYEVRVPKEEAALVSDLRYGWRKLRRLATDVSDRLAQLQAGFRRDLVREVRAFVADAQAFRREWDASGPMAPGLPPMEAMDRLRKFQQMFEVRKRKWDKCTAGEQLFGLAVTAMPELEQTEKEIAMLDRLYSLYVTVLSVIKGYGDCPWTEVVERVGEMGEAVVGFQAQCRKLPKALRDWPAYVACRDMIDNFLEQLPLFEALAHPAMRERHWRAVMAATGHQLNLAEDAFRLQHLLECNLLAHREEVEEIASAAVKEEAVETKLAAIESDWAAFNLSFADYKARGPVVLKPSDTAELIEKLEDAQMALGGMATNRYAAPFREGVAAWAGRLAAVGETLEQWLTVQNMWQYMEAVFSGGDIVKQLPAEAKRFQNIDKNYIKIVTAAMETKNVVAVCAGSELMRSMLPHLLEQLELVQKSLSAYLEAKRAEFPRFYFVSDPTLLEILSLGSDPPSVVPHFQSGLFDSLSNVTFSKTDKTRMLEMFSAQGEKVELDPPVDARGNIEAWLQRLVDGMQATVKGAIKRAVHSVYETGLQEFIFGQPAQVALLGIQAMWTADTQAALTNARTDKGAMTRNMKKTDALLREMVTLTVRSDLTRIQRTSLETCITVHMHQKESTEDLVKRKIRDPTDFDWLKQGRFYWREERGTVIISICDVDFEYSYEYLGVKERLVITPLTDVCYVTLSQALGMFLGGAPAGPAGTGKTETTKDLGNTLGKYVVVFNCSDQMDYKGMGKIFKGLAQSGLWGCFDEFNRINLDVLSVCAQQIYCVLSAIRERKRAFVFTDGSTVSLDPRVGFFITMNPGYAGRQELPENLKALFRGVTMMVPNRQIIIKVKLAACGYQENDVLSKKFFVLYGLCEQQLSKQPHYDFGLRNILSVLRTAGASKRANPDKSEVYLLMRTLRDMNMSKYVAEDVPLFMSLIDDLFPGLKAERASFPEVTRALERAAAERGLQPHAPWLNKCIQLYETYLVRHGIMLVGPSGGGKTAITECLAAALTEMGQKHVIWRMNPKAITAPQMFGRMDPATGDWTDGVFAVLWRRAAKARTQSTWIALDGPVDAIWIENLNTVLDDNKVLTLANGDRILMTPAMRAMFEPENLNNASPATVSRAGIICVSESELGWAPVAKSWLARRPDAAQAALLGELFDKYVPKLLDWLRVSAKPVMHNEQVCYVSTMLKLLSASLQKHDDAHDALPAARLERMFLYAAAWGLGGALDSKDRAALDATLRAAGAAMPPQSAEPDTLYEWFVDPVTGEWRHWGDAVPAWEYPAHEERPKFAHLVIPTLDSVRYERLLSLMHSVGGASLLVGVPGTAKTTVINQFLGRFSPDATVAKTITFSSLTTPLIFQTSIEGAVEKRQGRTYGPPGGRTMVVFIDDIAMPAINAWGDQVTNEIVRQLLEQGGMYSLDKPIGDVKTVADTRYVAAMCTPGGGKNDIPNRLKRQFGIFNVPLPSAASVNAVFGALVAGRFPGAMFAPEVVSAASRLVPMTVALWTRTQARMLPTPAKFHYLFNMRELSKVFQGVILAERDRFSKDAPRAGYGGGVTSPEGYLLALWLHECRRVFGDKLVSHDDKGWLDKQLAELCKAEFPPELCKQVEEPLYFVDFLRDPTADPETCEVINAHPSHYEAVRGGLPELRARVEALQRRFNEESKGLKLELVLFTDALQHLARISRLLAMDRGSALLVGVGGSGKQSLARLAAYIAGAHTFQITLTKTYSVQNLLEDIKGMYKVAGFRGQKVAFLFTDAEVKDEAFLEYINQALMTGEVAGLLPKDELDMIVNDIRPVYRAARPGAPDTWDALYRFFLERVRDNLHVVMCFSPVGAKFARRAQQFPGLVSGATIDWFLPWPEEALTSVSGKFIDEFKMACAPEAKAALKLMMGRVHSSVTAACKEYFDRYRRHVYVTPKSYLSFIQGYKELYARKWAYTRELAASIQAGLAKMATAKQDVNRMKAELAVKNQELAAASREAEALLRSISESTAVAEREKAKVAVIVGEVSSKAAEIAAVKDDAERDLAAAKPALDDALSALNSIRPADITALKALKSPPDIVKRIFDCVLLLRHWPIAPVSWQDVKGSMVIAGSYEVAVKMMGDLTFLTALLNFAKEQINDETVELLQPYFAAPDFNYDAARKASGNVAGLCNWAAAMCRYHEVAKVVEPKIAALRAAEAELKVATKEKNAAEERMAAVQAKLDEMQASFDAAVAQKTALEADAAATQRRMDGATALLHALAGEESRWTAQSKEFDSQIQRLTGDCAVACAFVSYLGPFNKEFRELLMARDFYGDCVRLNIPVTNAIQVTKFLVDDAEVGEWVLQGLPTDELSVQNGIMVTRASRYPVLIDPQGQGRAWIASREEANQLKVASLGDKGFRAALEDCLSLGRPLLIENVEEELDPVLDPVLERRLVRKGRAWVVQLADKEVDFADSFRLFATTRLPNPHFSPELCAKVTVVDFTVTVAGLEDQLLGKLILREKAELEQQRQALLEEVTSYRKKIRQLEDDLLFRLSNSQGNLLDDTQLIDVLAVTKQTAQDVSDRLANASETNRKINDACEEYRAVARRATLIYFLIAEFSVVSCMYQTSLAQFNELYERAIDGSERAAAPAKRIANIIDHMTYEIFCYVTRGLFERHKLIFALMLANKVLVAAGKVKPSDVDALLKGGASLDAASARRKPKDWIPDAVWLNVLALSSMDAFRDIPDSVFRNDGLWRQWYDQEAPETARVPDYEDRLSKFERMAVVKAFREDRALLAAADVIADALGPRFVEGAPLSMERAWAESKPRAPLICLLSPGSDPTRLIEELAKRRRVKTLGVSMGQGQEVIARKYVATAAAEGQWVLLQNAHLGLGYLNEVEAFLAKADALHDDFRLWITAEPHPGFPIGLLQMGIKITNEAPVGLRAGLRASYQAITQDTLDAVPRREWRQLLFVTCFLHSVVQERRKFGPIGWNVPYEFNASDLAAATTFLQGHLADMDAKRAPGPTWETVRYMVSVIQYGGRITDDFDQALMDAYAERYFHQGMLAPNCELARDDRSGFVYPVPDAAEVEGFRGAIEALPAGESPEVFGLHANADLTFRTLQVREAVSTILDTMPKGGGGGGGLSREEAVNRLCEDLLAKVPPPFDGEDVRDKLKRLPGGPTQPLTVHLRQEVDRLNAVLRLARATLADLRLAIAGTIALSGPLIDALDALALARIPPAWLRASWEAATLGAWFAGLLQRHDQLARWLTLGRPKSFWLPGFFNPQGFLTAVKQEVARHHAADKWALDDVVMASEVTHPPRDPESLREAPSEGVYIHGLYLDGAAWSGKENRLVDAEPKKLHCPLPVLHVTGALAKDRRQAGVYEAPCYRVKARRGNNFIATFGLRTEDDRSKWVLRGVALLCSVD